LKAFLVASGILDVNATKERIEALVAEARQELTALGVDPPTEPEPVPAPVDGMKPLDPATQA
jgi:hypothetical protein